MGFTPKQAAFIREYLVDRNGTQAAIRAGYSERTANEQASRLLATASVRKAVDEAINRRAARVEVKADDVLRELIRIFSADVGRAFDERGNILPIHEIPEDVRRAISSYEKDADGVVKVRFWSKPEALKLAGQHLKLFTEKHELKLFSEMTDEQLEQRKRELISKENNT